jgi:hypothetical protein
VDKGTYLILSKIIEADLPWPMSVVCVLAIFGEDAFGEVRTTIVGDLTSEVFDDTDRVDWITCRCDKNRINCSEPTHCAGYVYVGVPRLSTMPFIEYCRDWPISECVDPGVKQRGQEYFNGLGLEWGMTSPHEKLSEGRV